MAIKPITVSELNHYLARILETDPIMAMAAVRGEVSAPRQAASGHLYFTLKDKDSKISCMVPRDTIDELHMEIADGMEVTVRGRVHVYIRGGSYSLIVKSVEAEGVGALQIAFQKLKEKLEKEGLFDPAHKKPIPKFPKAVGVITSGTGAAVRDILKNLTTRNDVVDVIIFPVLVQGDQAAADVANAIAYANRKHPELDVLIVGRGGGSIEDLWAFNEEPVARAIYASEIPIISAVGHEIDFTISDMTADLRAETPTKGAVLAVPDTHLLREELAKMKQSLVWQTDGRLRNARLVAKEQRSRLILGMQNRIRIAEQELERRMMMLTASHPLRILQQGYAVVKDQDGNVVSDIRDLKTAQDLGPETLPEYSLIMKNGTARITVISAEYRQDMEENEKIR